MAKHKHLKVLFGLGEQIRNHASKEWIFSIVWDVKEPDPWTIKLPKSAIEEPEPHADDERIQ